MNRWLVDASVLLAREDSADAHHRDARRLLAGPGVIVTVDLAFYEVTNVAIAAWKDGAAARRLRDAVDVIAGDGGLVRATRALVAEAARLATKHGLSAYDAAYLAAAVETRARLVSCDVRDLVSQALALLPADALALDRSDEAAEPPDGPRNL